MSSVPRAAPVVAGAVRARSDFFDRVHGPLHTVAAGVSERDCSVAAMLLEGEERR